MSRKSGDRFSEKIMLKQKIERDDDSKKSHRALAVRGGQVEHGQPSQTARGAAAYRAIHQRLDGGVIFSDPFAAMILDDETGRNGRRSVAAAVAAVHRCPQPIFAGYAGGLRRPRAAPGGRPRSRSRYVFAAQSPCR